MRRNIRWSVGRMAATGLFLAALAAMAGCGKGSIHTKSGVEPVAQGQTLTRGQYRREGGYAIKPTGSILDTARIKQTYPVGQRTETTIRVILNGRAADADWGIVKDTGFHYTSVWVVDRHVISNDGRKLVEDVSYKRCRTVALYCRLRNIRISLGQRADFLLKGLAALVPKAGDVTQFEGLQAKPVLAMLPGLRHAANKWATDQAAKALGFVDALEGDKVRITFVNGHGVTSATPVNCTLTPRQVGFIMDSSLLGDVYIMPNLHCQPGSTWRVNGADLLPILDPSLNSTPSGTIRIMRGVDTGSKQDPSATLRIYSGVLDLRQAGSQWQSNGEWAPRGKLHFSFRKQMVTSGLLTGAIRLSRHSSHYIIFEARQAIQPQYVVKFTCKELP